MKTLIQTKFKELNNNGRSTRPVSPYRMREALVDYAMSLGMSYADASDLVFEVMTEV